MWDERVVKAIVGAARDDFRAERWGRDFADKLHQRGITKEMVHQAIGNADAIVLYRHRGLRSAGFWHARWRLIAVWSSRHPSRWVTAFHKPPDGKSYLMGQDDAELLWERG